MRKVMLVGLFMLIPSFCGATVSILRDASTLKRGTIDPARLDHSSVAFKDELTASITTVTVDIDSLKLFKSTGEALIDSWTLSQSTITSTLNALATDTTTLKSRLSDVATDTTTLKNALDVATETIKLRFGSSFKQVTVSSFSTNLALSSGTLWVFDTVQSSGNPMIKLISFPKSLSQYEIKASSIMVATTGTITQPMNFTIWIATFGTTTNFNTPVFNAAVHFTISEQSGANGGVLTVSNVTMTGWKEEVLGRAISAYIKITETDDANTVPPFFWDIVFEVIGYKNQ